MKPVFVLDASMTLSWCFHDEGNALSNSVLARMAHDAALVPSLWFLEIVNGLAMAEKRKRITAARSDEFLTQLSTFQIEIDEEAPRRAFTGLLPLCRAHRLTSYDAAYLELSERKRLPLATLDEDLRKGAHLTGIVLFD